MPLRGAAYETLRNGVRPPNLCFLNARDQLYAHDRISGFELGFELGPAQSRRGRHTDMTPAESLRYALASIPLRGSLLPLNPVEFRESAALRAKLSSAMESLAMPRGAVDSLMNALTTQVAALVVPNQAAACA